MKLCCQVQGGRLSSSSLDRYTCVALAGVVTEYLRFGQAEGGLGDVLQLDGMFRALNVSLSLVTAEWEAMPMWQKLLS